MPEPRWRQGWPVRFQRPGFASAIVAVALAGSVLAGVSWAGSWWLERRAASAAYPQESGDLRLPGLSGPAEILRDSRGIPHIEAETELDAWLCLGFVHAQDRLGQMLWLRRLARGRASEVVGQRGLANDRLMRTIGISRLADTEADRLTPELARLLAAYAVGVNARIDRVTSGAVGPPVDGTGPGGVIEPWSVRDTLAVAKLLAWSTDGGLESRVVLEDLLERLGAVGARPFFPTGRGVQGVSVPFAVPPNRPPPAGRRRVVRSESGDALTFAAGIRGGSSVVISSRHTVSGAPILVADLHLAPTVPALVHEVHLRGAALDVAGATVPGVPVFWAGHNRDVAWSASPARLSTLDLFREELRQRKPVETANGASQTLFYRDTNGWRPVERRTEVIRVREATGIRELPFEIGSTKHGALVHGLLPAPPDGAARAPLALTWAGSRPGDGVGALVALAQARSAKQVREILAQHISPALSVSFADRRGAAGMQVAGWVPHRVLPTGLVTVYGRQTAFDWKGPVAPEALPSVTLDAEGTGRGRSWLLVADDALGSVTDVQLEWLWRTGERARRLEQRVTALLSGGRIELKQAAALQSDARRADASELVEIITALAEKGAKLQPEAREIVDELRGWDGQMDAASRGAASFHVLMDFLVDNLFETTVGAELMARYLQLPFVRPQEIVAATLREAHTLHDRGGWTDEERVRAAVLASLRQTWFRMSYRLGPNRERWSWGRLHPLAFRAFVPRARLRATGPETRLGPFGASGDGATIAIATSAPLDPFAVSVVAAYRMAVDLSAPERMLSSLAPGQSEHLHHPHYEDGLARWLEGRPGLLVTNRLLLEEDSVEWLDLEPVP